MRNVIQKLVPVVLLTAVACANAPIPGASTSSSPTGPPTDLQEAQTAWAAADVGSYALEISVQCFCPPQEYRILVGDDGSVQKGAPENYLPETVEGLLSIIQKAYDDEAVEVRVTYNDVGVPLDVFIDQSTTMADEEIGYEVRFEDVGRQASPTPVASPADPLSPATFAGTWTDENGNTLPHDDPWVMATELGPEHCGWQGVVFLYLAWPLGTEVSQPMMGKPALRPFVRDPDGAFGGEYVAGSFDGHSTLPAGAYDSGYQHDGWQLWVDDPQIDEAVWLVNGDTVERWPAETDLVGCA